MFSGKVTARREASLTIKEAAVLSRVTEKRIRHELAARVLRPVRRRRHHVELDPSSVFFMWLVSSLPVELTKELRRDLFVLMADRRLESAHWRRDNGRLILLGDVPLVVPTAEKEREFAERVKIFVRGRARLTSDPEILGGEPIFAGTRVSVRHVGALAKKGVPLPALLEDFPNLSESDIEFARIFVELGRPPGRPRKLRLVRS